MMRILMLDNEYPPLGGGMGTANEALLRQFAQCRDMEIDLVTSALDSRPEEVQSSDRIRFYKVPVRNKNIHHSSNRELITYAFQARPLALRLHRRRPYDFCFAWSTLPAGAIARYLHWRTGLPYLVWASGPDIPGFELRYRHLYPILLPVLRSVWRNATPLIAKCRQEVDLIHASDSRVEVTQIPNGVDLAAFRPGPPIPDDGPLKLICVARLIERKGQAHLIQAIRRLVDDGVEVVADLVGDGDSLADYQALVERLGVGQRVNFLGYVAREDIPGYYAAAHVFVLPSYFEGMALAAVEALSAGLPLVVTRTGGTEDLVEEGVNGLTFDWADVDQLAAHLRCLAGDRALARRMGAASRARAARYGWEAIAATYRELFAGLCA
jgi:glycosyltransferase involved in cell wall biosynthesis